MEAPAGQVQCIWMLGFVQNEQNAAQALCMICVDASG
ncbi:hypothetical protein CF150_13113 [Pseudomonas sp. CF150]|nr:hypothetical protein CF150_13113 [Pseudomonas sp. CF150]